MGYRVQTIKLTKYTEKCMTCIRCFTLSLFITYSSVGFAAQTGQSCENKAKQVAPEKRDAFITSCLAQVSAPSNVKEVSQQNKRRTCEQNAKNLKLNPNNRSGYFDQCMNKNEAASKAKIIQNRTEPTARNAAKKSCAQRAKEQNLTGHARKRFMSGCTN